MTMHNMCIFTCTIIIDVYKLREYPIIVQIIIIIQAICFTINQNISPNICLAVVQFSKEMAMVTSMVIFPISRRQNPTEKVYNIIARLATQQQSVILVGIRSINKSDSNLSKAFVQRASQLFDSHATCCSQLKYKLQVGTAYPIGTVCQYCLHTMKHKRTMALFQSYNYMLATRDIILQSKFESLFVQQCRNQMSKRITVRVQQ